MAPPLARDALGLGLRVPHYAYLREHEPKLDYFEIISENFFGDAEIARKNLDFFRARHRLVLHGVGLNLLGPDEPSAEYLDRLAWLAEYVDAPFFTDHLCWTGAGGRNHHDLLPTPYTDDLIAFAAERARRVAKHVGRPFGLENLSSYVAFRSSTLTEWAFYSKIVAEANCSFMLDLNNIYVSSENHGFAPLEYLEAIDFGKVLQVHLAGHTRVGPQHLIDTHDAPVADAVWELYRQAWQRGGPFPTLLEWDDHIPDFPTALAELEKARTFRETAS